MGDEGQTRQPNAKAFYFGGRVRDARGVVLKIRSADARLPINALSCCESLARAEARLEQMRNLVRSRSALAWRTIGLLALSVLLFLLAIYLIDLQRDFHEPILIVFAAICTAGGTWCAVSAMLVKDMARRRIFGLVRNIRRQRWRLREQWVLCSACGFELTNAPIQADGCIVCPECGAAWKLTRST